ncbi:hypothetical protein [Jannaschia marina]|uniref:hypothetical protein n=1 Tax=Jannaschia marina TaxID=2741674 RepID=UPI0015C7630C|nr:hypothetical protein [Jannaschia marina]
MMMILRALAIAAMVSVGDGCEGTPNLGDIQLGVGTPTNGPVYLLELVADDARYPLTPNVQQGGVDAFPRMSRPVWVQRKTQDAQFEVRAVWIEILSGRAYEARITVDATELAVDQLGADVVALLMPGGRMVIGSDPVPKSREVVTRDIAETCGTRRPDLDRDITGEVNAIANLREALAFATDPIEVPPCGEGN